jgi:hypothetical protein
MNGNNFMSWVLRSPLHGFLSNSMLLLSVTGLKTGKIYPTPVEYYEQDGFLWIITLRNRTWWRNLRRGAEVSLLLKRESVTGFAEVDLDEKSVEARMYEYLKYMPQKHWEFVLKMELQTLKILRGSRRIDGSSE